MILKYIDGQTLSAQIVLTPKKEVKWNLIEFRAIEMNPELNIVFSFFTIGN